MQPEESNKVSPAAIALVVAGVLLALLAWLIPVSLKSISPGLLKSAGAGTPSLAAFGRDLVDSEKIGPAAFVLEASRSIQDPREPALDRALDTLESKEPALVAWGGWDPGLDPLLNLRAPTSHQKSTPVLTFFISESVRETLRAYLANSGSIGVQSVLKTRDIPATGRFVPAYRPGGQPLDALVLLTAILYQGEHLSPTLQREVRSLAETAVSRKELGDLEGFYMDLLSLGRRLDWTQLSELLRRTESVRTVGEYAHLARVAPDQFTFIYAAALFTDSSDRVASYLIEFGKPGADDLRLAVADGQGAAKLLLERQVPVNHSAGPALSAAGTLVLEQPKLMLFVKYVGYFAGFFLLLHGLDLWVVSPDVGRVRPVKQRARAGALAVILSALLIIVTEPFLLKAAPVSEYQLHLHMPMLLATSQLPVSNATQTPVTMEKSTLISIGIFAALQVVMYLICLKKIVEIDQQNMPPLLKLRLMENEENLFDSGLYVGMMGTAAALVLQVVGAIAPNLLAAYSSNLFGIVCVALVKIRHVRGFKRRLILQSQAPVPGAAPVAL